MFGLVQLLDTKLNLYICLLVIELFLEEVHVGTLKKDARDLIKLRKVLRIILLLCGSILIRNRVLDFERAGV